VYSGFDFLEQLRERHAVSRAIGSGHELAGVCPSRAGMRGKYIPQAQVSHLQLTGVGTKAYPSIRGADDTRVRNFETVEEHVHASAVSRHRICVPFADRPHRSRSCGRAKSNWFDDDRRSARRSSAAGNGQRNHDFGTPVSPLHAKKAEESFGAGRFDPDLECDREVAEYRAVGVQPAGAFSNDQRAGVIAHTSRTRLSSHPPGKTARLNQRMGLWR